MKHITHKHKILFIGALVFIIFLALGIFLISKDMPMAEALDQSSQNSISLFGDKEVSSANYLYNYDDSADYILVKFKNQSGYAILAKDTYELLEYSDEASPYEEAVNKAYYGGPNKYYEKSGECFSNLLTNETFSISKKTSENLSKKSRQLFSVQSNSNKNLELNKLESVLANSANEPKVPPLDERNPISPNAKASYIENGAYFMTNGAYPRHGENNGESCTTIAVQLMLSFNNYYNDRRIIDNQHLFGTNDQSSNLNPNYSADPMLQTSYTLGSTQTFHDFLFNSNITGYLSTTQHVLKNYLNNKKVTYSVNCVDTWPNSLPTSDVVSELDADRPLVLSTENTLNGTDNFGDRKFDHSVIAYGYQTLSPYAGNSNSYLGYIVHFGWDSDGSGDNTKVWTNSAWYYSSLKLNIDHTHNYAFVSGDFQEYKCGTCGHRTSAYITKNIDDSKIAITGLRFDLSGDVFLPTNINNRTVNEIGLFAFQNQGNLASIDIPASLETIGGLAFMNCSYLQFVTFEEGSRLTTLGAGAFINCGSLGFLNLPDGVSTIGANAFAYCYSLVLFRFGETGALKTIGNYAFDSCASIQNLTIPASVETIGNGAFRGCSYISWIEFEADSKLKTIGYSAFESCGSMSYFYMPSGVTGIGSDAFAKCGALKTINLWGNVSTIGANAFKDCGSLSLYVNAQSAQPGWSASWNISARPVIWGCIMSGGNYVSSFVKSASNPSNSAGKVISQPISDGYAFDGWFTTASYSGTQYTDLTAAPNGTLYAKWEEASCVAEGTLITLADGTQKAVEDLTGDEMLLVWNLFTGQFDAAPILFIDSDPAREYEVINLHFSDGTVVKVIDKHGFWDFNLNEYVFLRSDAAKYIGHWFNKQTADANGNMDWTKVRLTNVVVQTEYTTAWSPVTYGHLCYYVNGMLSMPGATTGFINIFDVNPDTMKIDQAAMQADIAKYGLFTYEEFAALYPVPEVIFEAFGGQYLKIAMGKGLLTEEMLNSLIARYSIFFL